jgi:hypothetical protein
LLKLSDVGLGALLLIDDVAALHVPDLTFTLGSRVAHLQEVVVLFNNKFRPILSKELAYFQFCADIQGPLS